MTRMIVRGAIAAGFVSAVILVALASGTPRAAAQDQAWCVITNLGSENCGYATMAQCLASANGFGGFCRMSYYAPQPSARPRR